MFGYTVVGCHNSKTKNLTKNYLIEECKKKAMEGDAFRDNPWSLLYKEMDVLFPNSKFILTLRDPQKWIVSATNYFKGWTEPMRAYTYGETHQDPVKNRDHWLKVYHNHTKEVKDYFKNRKNDLLVFNIETDELKKICKFLNIKNDLNKKFPHSIPDQITELGSGL